MTYITSTSVRMQQTQSLKSSVEGWGLKLLPSLWIWQDKMSRTPSYLTPRVALPAEYIAI